jgi:hypothetical protein
VCACSDDADEDGDAMWNMMMMFIAITIPIIYSLLFLAAGM